MKALSQTNQKHSHMLMVSHGGKVETTLTEDRRLVMVKLCLLTRSAHYFLLTGKNGAVNMVHTIMVDNRWPKQVPK